MCFQKIRVLNPTRRFQPGVSKQYLEVPCGHCPQCSHDLQDDWFVRALFEFERCQNSHGHTLFVLFTYDNENLPWFECPETGFTVPCFDNSHIKHFRDTLRVNLLRLGYDCTGENAIRYKCCPEYGGKLGRPHYHVLIFIPNKDIPLSLLVGHYDPKTKRSDGLIQKSWSYGFVSWSKDHGAEIKSSSGIEYAMKYVSKEQRWYKIYGIDIYKEWLDEQLNTLDKYVHVEREIVDGMIEEHSVGLQDAIDKWEYFKDLKRAFKRCQPRSMSSTYFGVDGISCLFKEDEPQIDMMVNNVMDLSKLKCSISSSQSNYTYRIPRYYEKLLFRHKDGYGLDVLTPLGIKIYGLRYWLIKKRLSEKFHNYFGSWNEFQRHVGFASLGKLAPYEMRVDYKQLQSTLNGRPLDDLSMYAITFRDVPLAFQGNIKIDYDLPFDPFNPEHDGYNNIVDHLRGLWEHEHIEFFRSIELSFYMSQHNLLIEPQPEKQAYKWSKSFRKRRPTYGSIPCFYGFDYILEIIDKYETLRKKAQKRSEEIKSETNYQYSVVTNKLLD